MSDKKTACKIKILSDDPSDEDEFGGGHKATAEAIVKLIKSNEAGKTIGLFGNFGSGKSTVIEKIKQDIDGENTEERIFVFDAWIHQSDPIRRSFLEKLIIFVEPDSLNRKKKWGKTLNKIANKSEERRITFWGYSLFVSILMFLPIGLALLPHHETLNFPDDIEGNILAFILTISPIIIAILAFIQKKYFLRFIPAFTFVTFCTIILANLFYTGDHTSLTAKGIIYLTSFIIATFALLCSEINEDSEDEDDGDKNIWHYFLNTAPDTIKTPDPTAIEFQEIFKDIIKEIKYISEENPIVIVIDNLDRLDEKVALELWESIRNFFEDIETKPKKNIKSRIWVITPIDKRAIEKFFIEKEAVKTTSSIVISSQNETHDNNLNKAKLFFEKTFALTFQIGPPVLSNWYSYFQSQMEKAFNKELSDDEIKDIIYIYNMAHSDETTPREIKCFINNLIATYLRWKGEIPILCQALYLSHRNSIEQNIDNLANLLNRHGSTGHIEPSVLNTVNKGSDWKEEDNKWKKNVAAIYYNSTPNDALQMIIGDQIRDALRGYKKENEENPNYKNIQIDEILTLCKYDGFDIVLKNTIKNLKYRRTWKDPTELMDTSICLGRIQKENAQLDLKKCWGNLEEIGLSIENWGQVSDNTAEGLSYFLKNCPDKEKPLGFIFENIKNNIENIQTGNNFKEEYLIDTFITLYEADIDKSLNWNDFDIPIKENIAVNYISLLSTAIDTKKISHPSIRMLFSEKHDGRIKEIIDNITNSIDDECLVLIKDFIQEYPEFPWEYFIEGYKQDMTRNSLYQFYILDIIKNSNKIRYGSKIDEICKKLANSPELINMIAMSGILLNSKAVTLVISTLLKHNPELSNIPETQIILDTILPFTFDLVPSFRDCDLIKYDFMDTLGKTVLEIMSDDELIIYTKKYPTTTKLIKAIKPELFNDTDKP